ncbi:probable carboxylesterase 15 [Malania oleifera]|uniref:probable carboxylesterase 15 n=1 Tax=Malania oleifera TaxID=397392 RepID=UPI0025ADE10D|nr:probable carboxylesterase 15 [Malania oleifera]
MGSLPHIVEDCLGVLQLYSDGSVCRSAHIDFPIAAVDDGSVPWKDSLYDETHHLHLRLYKPAAPPAKLLPVLYFIHGGGFCLGSRTWPNCHTCCLRLAAELGALVVAPDYRLAPEHRLPAAVEDVLRAVQWLQAQAVAESGDAWVREEADFDRVFIMGDSSGGNIAHQLAVRIGSGSVELSPVRVRGFVLLAPFFGGSLRTRSEEGPPESYLSLELLDRFWRLCLPIGDTMDHPLVNPFGPASPNLKSVRLDPILAVVGGEELMKDRVEDYARRLKELGKKIQYVEFGGKQHGFLMNDPFSKEAKELLQVIKKFMRRLTHIEQYRASSSRSVDPMDTNSAPCSDDLSNEDSKEGSEEGTEEGDKIVDEAANDENTSDDD